MVSAIFLCEFFSLISVFVVVWIQNEMKFEKEKSKNSNEITKIHVAQSE